MPTKIVFAAETSVVVADEPHEIVTKLKHGTIQFESVSGDGAIQLLNPALICYLQKVDAEG
jgi:hypothetical protein